MSFANLSGGAVAIGVAVLAVGLFLLQRLRVRYQPRRVVTTLFWKEALEEARARVFVRRFRHLLAYLFILLIASLLWFGFADPQWQQGDDADHVLLVDGSAGMGFGTRFADVLEAVKERVASLPRDRRSVILCGSRPQALLLPGEHERVLDRRLDGVAPEACPSTIERTLRSLVNARDTDRDLAIHVAGDGPVRAATRALLPKGVKVTRLASSPEREGNRGITALGVVPASSGAWDRVDVLAEVRGDAEGLVIEVDGRALPQGSAVSTPRGDAKEVLVRDVAARGGVLTISLPPGDGLAVDDRASIRLPDRPRIKVALAASLTSALRPVLEADPGVEIVVEGADVAVRKAGETTGGTIPALEWIAPDAQTEAILLRHERTLPSRQVLMDSFDRLGLEDVDTTDLATRTGRVISLGASPADRRGVSVWNTLLGQQYNFVHSRSFPLFIAASIRWLAGTEDFPSYVAAGEPVVGIHGAMTTADGRTLDPAGSEFIPPAAGSYTQGSSTLVASLLDVDTTLGRAAAVDDEGETAAPTGAADALTIIALLALALLCAEWVLYRTGRMP